VAELHVIRSVSVRLVGLVVFLALNLAVPRAASGQPRVLTLEELRRELTPGDVILVVQRGEAPVKGRLLRIGNTELEMRLDLRQPSGRQGRPEMKIPMGVIESLERPRDSSRNGALIGGALGAGAGLTMFVGALVVDYNEIDEWAPIYLGLGGVLTGAGALIGWAIDSARSKPHVRYGAPSAPRMTIRAVPLLSHGRGMALVVSF
jgi:hypothetical protein